MKRITVIAAALVLLASGCATQHAVPPANPAMADVDGDKVTLVNRVATARGVEVHWINYPQRRTPSTGT